MVDIVVRSVLGPWGSALLDAYIQNSLWINSILVIYALVVIFSRRNYARILKQFTQHLSATNTFKKHKTKHIQKQLQKAKIPWDDALGFSSFPFIAPPGSLCLYSSNLKSLQKTMSDEILAETIAQSN
ncbi:MAG: hypothetical protein DWQ07_07300 [Chloroflexi bacterium]|nr:MAG: hypothetical protein DWQ07_07300 [Chloroflexota bacterium]MBL1195493.1 hypothetical protein [Chloroflexota bacterium]NOH12775.1 hypothetical protein [Chloroflexota bacterium]